MSRSEHSRHISHAVDAASTATEAELVWEESPQTASVPRAVASAGATSRPAQSPRHTTTIAGWVSPFAPADVTAPHGTVQGESAAPIDAEFIDSQAAPPPAVRDWTGGPAHTPPRPPRINGGSAPEPSMGLAVVEPSYTAPPLPPWLRVNDAGAPAGGASSDLVMLTAPDGPAAQQFRTLRYRVERAADAQIIAVTSARAKEGKSVTAANLALALAEGGRVRVLLVDGALRTPSVAERFGLDPSQGLTAVLGARNDDPRATIDVTQVRRNLFVMPAGPQVVSPHAALASEAAAGLLGSLRRAFRYIVVDASPVLGPAETLAWQGMIDRYILVARQGLTSTEDLGRAADRVGRDKILGVTLVGVAPKSIAS